ncbi:MAG: L,D-transpeptidase family protein [Longimicrobiales bacterium]
MKGKRGLALLVAAAAGCGGDGEERPSDDRVRRTRPSGDVTMLGGRDARLTPEAIERGRRDTAWRRYVEVDSAAVTDTARGGEAWSDISVQSLNEVRARLPLHGDAEGPSVMRVQILLDRARFSPGVIDGRWGQNTEKAVYWLQQREGLRRTGVVDATTYERLAELAGGPARLVNEHRLGEEDVPGPFVRIPEDIYAHAELDCSCYESPLEAVSERFHVTPEALEQLNPDVALSSLAAGDRLLVPAVRDRGASAADSVAEIRISAGGHYLHALAADGRLLYHFPTTLGSDYDPSPSGEFEITSITLDPWWHYQPELLANVPDDEANARIPPGPNNAVGVVWLALSEPHYGIHGTSAPETIGYATSSGCVRLTNWDARFLAERVREGTRVRFRDVQ